VLCELAEVSILITDDGLPDICAQYVERAGVKLITVPVEAKGRR
jgi:hypothetical protein